MTIVDIVIPVHNRPRHTEQTIMSLVDNTPKDLYTLNIINDGSQEETGKLLLALEQRAKSRGVFVRSLAHVFPMSPGYSRNQMCRDITKEQKRSKYLYHSDNDVYFTPGWLEKLIGVFEHSESDNVKVLGASCHPYLQSSRRIYCDIHSYAIGIKDAVSGYSQLMTWETWDEFGPFDETMKNAEKKIMGSEDWAFCQKIIKAGYLVGSIEPELVIPCGKTNTYGEPATGSETFKNVPGVLVY